MLEGILHLNLFTVVIILYMVVILREEKCLCRNLLEGGEMSLQKST